jgi:hypothetical protein
MGLALQILIDFKSGEMLNFGYSCGFAVCWHPMAGYLIHVYKNEGAREKMGRQMRPTAVYLSSSVEIIQAWSNAH